MRSENDELTVKLISGGFRVSKGNVPKPVHRLFPILFVFFSITYEVFFRAYCLYKIVYRASW